MNYSQFRTVAATLIQQGSDKAGIKAYFNGASEAGIIESVNNIHDGIQNFRVYYGVIYCATKKGVCEVTERLYDLDELMLTEDEYLVHKEHVTVLYIYSYDFRYNNTLYYAYIRNAMDKYDVVEYEGQYYDIDCLHEYDLVLTEEGDIVHFDDAYRWRPDGRWHSKEEPERGGVCVITLKS